jgi:hypothetical protein
MSQPTGARAGRRDILLRQEAYASEVDPRSSQLAYSSLEFNLALQSTNDLSQFAHYRERTAPASHE